MEAVTTFRTHFVRGMTRDYWRPCTLAAFTRVCRSMLQLYCQYYNVAYSRIRDALSGLTALIIICTMGDINLLGLVQAREPPLSSRRSGGFPLLGMTYAQIRVSGLTGSEIRAIYFLPLAGAIPTCYNSSYAVLTRSHMRTHTNAQLFGIV